MSAAESLIEAAPLLLVAALAGLNLYVSVCLLRSDEWSRGQKVAQLLLVWLLPLIGALTVFYFLNDADHNEPPAPPPFGGGAGSAIHG